MVKTIKAYAKINIALNVYGRRENGYHDVDMVMLPLELHDIIEFNLLPRGYETYITSDDLDLPTDESNLAIKSFLKLREKFSIKENYMIHIYKRIPMSAGLGGGSADAAAVFNQVLKDSKVPYNEQEIIDYGKEIGGDVPFCLYNKPARCRGIGEKLDFISLKKKYFVLLVKPKQGVDTGECYRAFDKLDPKPQTSNIERMIKGLEDGNDEVIAYEMKNSLQACAVNMVPEIKTVIDKLKDDGFPMTMMSGSGSTVFCLSTDKRAIVNESKKFSEEDYTVVVTATL